MQQLYGQFPLFPCFLWRTFSFATTRFIWSLRSWSKEQIDRLINSTAFILFSTTDHFTSQYISLMMWPDHPHQPLVHTQSFCSWSLKLLSSEKRNKVTSSRARGGELTSFAAPFIVTATLDPGAVEIEASVKWKACFLLQLTQIKRLVTVWWNKVYFYELLK